MFRRIGQLIAAILKKEPLHSNSTHEQEIKVTIKTETTHAYVDRLLAKGEALTLVDLDGYISPSGGFVNWATYEVSGKNISTNRKNKRRYNAKTEANAIKQAEADGLAGPFDIVAIKHDDPTEKQLQYLQSWGVSVPVGANKFDVSTILSRLEDESETITEKRISKSTTEERVRLLPGPASDFAKFADSMGVKFSRFIGKGALFDSTLYHLTGRDRVAFYAYCVICANKKTEIGDMRDNENFARLYEFADAAIENPSLLRSIEGRSANDYLHPHKGSAAYKAVAEFFALK